MNYSCKKNKNKINHQQTQMLKGGVQDPKIALQTKKKKKGEEWKKNEGETFHNEGE